MLTAALRSILAVLATVLLLAGEAGGAVPDPTRPPTAEEIRAWRDRGSTGAAAWRLESILISDRRRVAVINGHTVSRGDSVGDARVASIEPGSVTLKTNGKTLELTLDGQARSSNIRQDR